MPTSGLERQRTFFCTLLQLIMSTKTGRMADRGPSNFTTILALSGNGCFVYKDHLHSRAFQPRIDRPAEKAHLLDDSYSANHGSPHFRRGPK